MATVLPHEKPGPLAFGPVSTLKPGLCKPRYLAPIKCLSSDRIMSRSVHRLCRLGRSFNSRFRIGDPTNIGWVANENLLISCIMSLYFTATQWISVKLQMWKREVKDRLVLHNLRTDHVMIRSELKYLTGAKVAGTVIWNRSRGTTRPKNCWFSSGPSNHLTKATMFGFLAGLGTKPNWTASQKAAHWRVTRTRC